jgi:GNAT superfamily N-acetyltransferase
MPVTVKPVESRKELSAFVKFPLKLYRDCPHYVPSLFMDEMSSLDMDKNPMGKYARCEKFLAYNEKGEIVGRVAAIINDIANRDWNHREVRFGWIDFIDDKEVSQALVDAVIAYGRKNGMTQVSGPLGFTDFDNEGCVVEGFDDISSFNLKYNFPYYKDHFEALGLAKVNDWLEYRIFVPEQVPEKVSRAAALVQERYNLHIRRITKREVRKEGYGRKIFDLINRAYSQLFDFTVLPDDVIDSYVNTYLGLIDLKFITLIEDAEGKLVGVSLMMPSIARAAALVQERYDLHIRRITKREVRREGYGRKIFDLINRAYSQLFDFTVLPDDVIDSYVNTYLGMIDLRYITLIEDKAGKLVGVSLTMPSIARAAQKCRGYLFPTGWWHLLKSTYWKHEDGLELLMIAVDPDYRNRGIHSIIFNDLIPMLIEGGFKYGESNAEMETNNSVQNLWNLYQKEFKRRRRVYSKEI